MVLENGQDGQPALNLDICATALSPSHKASVQTQTPNTCLTCSFCTVDHFINFSFARATSVLPAAVTFSPATQGRESQTTGPAPANLILQRQREDTSCVRRGISHLNFFFCTCPLEDRPKLLDEARRNHWSRHRSSYIFPTPLHFHSRTVHSAAIGTS